MSSHPPPLSSSVPVATGGTRCPALAEVLRTEELQWRPVRPSDHRTENTALATMLRTMAEAPEKIFQELADQVLALCLAGSAGISLFEQTNGQNQFHWVATAGAFRPLQGSALPRDFSPCGVVLDENSAQLMVRPERAYPYIAGLSHPVEEVLLVPFYSRDVPVGTVWVVAHDPHRHFDREDLRLVDSLSKFAALAWQANAQSLVIEADREALGQKERERRRVASELSHARQRLDSVLMADEIGFYEWSVATNRVDGDENFFRIFGMDSNGPADRRLEQFVATIHPDDREPTQQRIRRALDTGEDYETDYRIVRDSGERWVRARGRIARDSAGLAARFSGVVLDITDRKRAEQERQLALDESARVTKIYDTILSATDDFAYIFDPHGRFIYANRSLLRVWAKRLDQIIGKTCHELGYPAWHADMHMREIAQVIATKQPIRGEVPFTGGSGISGIYDYIFTPVLGDGGRVEFIAGTTRDVSERRRLADRDQLLIALDDATRPLTDALAITQKSSVVLGKHLGVNRCAYAEVHEDQNTFDFAGDYNSGAPGIVGRYRFEQFGEECLRLMRAGEPFVVQDTELDPRTAGVREFCRTARIRALICVPLHKSGRLVAALAVHQTSPRTWHAHEIELLLLVANRCRESIERTRITRELAASERELQRVVLDLAAAQRGLEQHANVLENTVAERTARLQETVSELEAFSYSVSHDLRGPLRVMRSFAQALREDCGADVNALGQDYIRRIIAAAERMDRVIQDVLEYSRIVRTDLRLEPVALEEFVIGLIESYPEFERAEISVEPGLPVVMSNRAALTQCFSNLIGNALKFVAPGVTPRVTLRALAAADHGVARVLVEDNGIGIEPGMREKIFGAFYRLDHSYEGTGIGLAIVRKAAERVGGRVGVESSPGGGSAFHLELPLAPADSPDA